MYLRFLQRRRRRDTAAPRRRPSRHNNDARRQSARCSRHTRARKGAHGGRVSLVRVRLRVRVNPLGLRVNQPPTPPHPS